MKYVMFLNRELETISFPLAAYGNIDSCLVDALHASGLTCFLPYEIQCAEGVPTDIEVGVKGVASLGERLQEPLNASDMAALFRHVHDLIESCAYHGLPFMNVVLDTECIFYTELTDGLSFIYLPVSGKVRSATLTRDFFEEFKTSLKPADAQAEELLDKFSRAFQKNDPFNLLMLSDVLGNLASSAIADVPGGGVASKCDPSSQQGSATTSEDSKSSDADIQVDAERAQDSWASGKHVREDPGTSVLNAVDIEEFITTESASLIAAEETAIEGGQEPVALSPNRYRLVHKRSGCTADVFGTNFTVGKSKRANFQVLNTTTVSRIHALFTCMDDACSLRDNQSLNGTFVNERRIQPSEDVRLKDGDVIRMSDEEFFFEVISQGSKEVLR